MAALPPLNHSRLVDMVYEARKAEASDWDGLGLSPSALGTDCDRALWLGLRWAAPKGVISGRTHFIFDDGHYHEAKMVAALRRAGLVLHEVDENGKQFPVRAMADHFRGKMDGIIESGVPEAPEKTHVFEAKSHNKASFAKVKKGPTIKEAKFEHYCQIQAYLHITGIDRALYGAVCKDDSAYHFERVRYDNEFCVRLFARLERILRTNEPPPKITDKPDAFVCRFCRARELCWGNSFPRLNCRTCVHSSPEMTGNAAWSCARHVKPLSPDEQRAACPNHLFIPAIVPGEMLEVNEDAETISYVLHDGREWTDGRDLSDAPVEVEVEGKAE